MRVHGKVYLHYINGGTQEITIKNKNSFLEKIIFWKK